MHIHTDRITERDVYRAASAANVDAVTVVRFGSRKRTRRIDVKLEGSSKRRPNSGQSGSGSGYAATWDEWGVFIGHLYAVDPSALIGPYTNSGNFIQKTDGAYAVRPA